jgi:signal peptidase
VVSGSMSPAIAVGDVTIVRDVAADDIVEGDVIQYAHDSITTIHRVIDIQQVEGSTVFITQGDANQDPDGKPVHPEQIKGKVQLCIPKVGWVSIGIKNLFSRLI